MSIKKRLYLSVGVVAIVLIGLALFSTITIRETEKSIVDIEKYPEIQALIGSRTIDHFKWVDALQETIFLGKEFTGQIDPTKCALGQWYYNFTPPKELEDTYKKIEEPHRRFHATAPKIIEAVKKGNRALALKIYQEETLPLLEQAQRSLTELNLSMSQIITGKLKDIESLESKMLSITVIIYAGIIGALLLGFTLFIVKPVKKGLSEISERIQEFSMGDFSKEININSNDEIGKMASELNKMAKKLKEIIYEIKSTADSVASASNQLSAASEQMSRGIQEHSDRSSQIASSAIEMSQTIMDIAKNTSNIAATAKDAERIAQDGGTIVNKSIKEVDSIAETVNETAKMISLLGERSKQIGEIVNVIRDIADQTNLLALNAAIEAARAGEQGRGFAVVADEVRKLAERTAKATSEIADMINTIQSEVEKVVSSMQNVAKKTKTGVELSEQAGNALQSIVDSITNLNSMIQQIASATEEISRTSESISSDIEVIANISKESSASAEQVASSAIELAKLASNLQSIVEQFKV